MIESVFFKQVGMSKVYDTHGAYTGTYYHGKLNALLQKLGISEMPKGVYTVPVSGIYCIQTGFASEVRHMIAGDAIFVGANSTSIVRISS